MAIPNDDGDWRYWRRSPPDPRQWQTIEWVQGDEDCPWDVPPYAAPVGELLAEEVEGWLTVGVWWRPIPWRRGPQ
jgi:hypothetical protein